MKINSNQFIVSSSALECIEYVNKYESQDINFYFGDKISFNYLHNSQKSIYTIGFINDLNNHTFDEIEILNDLIKCDFQLESILDKTRYYNGRWILIFKDSYNHYVLTDALAQRQVFYLFKDGRFLLSSQAKYIAEIENIAINENHYKYFNLSKNLYKEFSMPLHTTLYKDINRLLPNHLLDINLLIQKRFFPYKNTIQANSKISSNNFVLYTNEFIKKSIEPYSSKMKNAVFTITAGFDSRLIASNIVHTGIDFVTYVIKDSKENLFDVSTGIKISEILSGQHTSLVCDKDRSQFFIERNQDQIELMHDYWAQFSEVSHYYNISDCHLIKGSGAEIFRDPYGRIPNKYINSKLLCDLFDLQISDFSINIIDKWLHDLRKDKYSNNFYYLDLFYWEHRMGSWLAQGTNELSVIQESYMPFNNRNFLEEILNFKSKCSSIRFQYLLKKCIKQNNKSLSLIKYNKSRRPLVTIVSKTLFYFAPYLRYKIRFNKSIFKK